MEKKSFLLVLSTAIISGVSIYMNKFAIKGIDSDIFSFSKNILVGVFMLSVLLISTKVSEFKKLSKKDVFTLLLISFIGGSIPFILFFKGLQLTSASSASLIHKSMFVLVSVLAFVFLKEKINKRVIFAMGLLMTGNYFLIKPTFSFNLGDVLVISATLLWALENTVSKYALKNLSGNMVAFSRMFFGSLFILIYLFFTGKYELLLNLTQQQTQWVLISTGMLALYVITWYNGLKHVNVSLATAILLLGSPITTLLSFAPGAAISASQALGTLLLVSGVVVYIHSAGYISMKHISRLWKKKIEV